MRTIRRIIRILARILAPLSVAIPFSAYGTALRPEDTGLKKTAESARYLVDEKVVSVPQFAGTVINAALGIIGVVFLVLIVYGGLLWMLSEGDETKVGKARGLIFHSIIGLIVVLAAYAITSFVVGSLIAETLN